MNKSVFVILGIVVAFGAFVVFTQTDTEQVATTEEVFTIGLTQIITHPGIDEFRVGVIEGLAERGYVEGENLEIIFRNANGDQNLTLPIAQDFVAKGVDVLVPISTPSSLSVAKVSGDIPVIFVAVSDPVGVGLVAGLDQPGELISGTSDQWPFRKQIETYLDIVPETKSIGMLYTLGDDVAKSGLDAMEEMAAEGLFELDARPISQPSDIFPTTVDILKTADVFYTGIDIVVAENLNSVFKAAQEANKPVLAGDSSVAELGAVMALSVSLKEVGKLGGDMVANVFEGTSPGEMPVRVVSDGDLYVNKAVAEKFGIDVEKLRTDYPDATFFE